MDADSPYLKLDPSLLNKLLPLSFPSPQSKLWFDSLTPTNVEYGHYYCTVHNESWEETTVKRPNAIKQAERKIDEVRHFVQDSISVISPNDANALDALINALQSEIDDPLSMSIIIVQRTEELDEYYQIVKFKTDTTPTPEDPEDIETGGGDVVVDPPDDGQGEEPPVNSDDPEAN